MIWNMIQKIMMMTMKKLILMNQNNNINKLKIIKKTKKMKIKRTKINLNKYILEEKRKINLSINQKKNQKKSLNKLLMEKLYSKSLKLNLI